jgi:sec-independent protein translocase protein TatA
MGLGPQELLLVALIVIVLFGGRKLPELGAGIGKALANFKRGYKEAEAIDITPEGAPHSAPSRETTTSSADNSTSGNSSK